MNFRKISFLGIIILFGVTNLFSQGINISKPAASVNLIKAEMISVQQLNNQVEYINKLAKSTGQGAQGSSKEDKLNVLDMMISDILVKQGADRAGVVATKQEIDSAIETQKAQFEQQISRPLSLDDFKKLVLQQTGVSWDNYKEQIEKQLVQRKYIMAEKSEEINKASKLPDNDEIEEFYKKNKTQLTNPEMVRYSQIFVSTLNMSDSEVASAKKRAEEAYNKYQRGKATFEELVNDYTEDNTAKYRNGDTGYIAYGDPQAMQYFGKNFVDKLFDISVGDVDGLIKSNLGYHIVKVTEYREAKILKLDDPVVPGNNQTVREYIAQRLIAQAQNDAVSGALNELVEDLKKDAEIKIYEENIE